MKKLFRPWVSLLFVTLPQALLAAALFYAYRRAAITPSLPLIVIFSVQALFNVFVIVCAAVGAKFPSVGKALRITQLVSLIAVVSAAAPFLLDQFDFASSLSPEAIYGTLCLIPLIYIETSILYHNGVSLKNVSARIAVCVCVPLCFSLLTFAGLFSGTLDWTDSIDWMHGAASIVLILLFALFFVFVCLVTSIIYHYKTKAPAPTNAAGQIKNSEPAAGNESAERNEIEAPKATAPAVKEYTTGYSLLVAVLALFLPLFCLFLNNGVDSQGMFGDFSGVWFYLLAIMNGIAMLIPQKNKWLTLGTLFFKSAGFLYVFYFVVTMIRYAPIGVTFYAFLLPLLVLTPIPLFVLELFQIIDDFKYLKQHFSGFRVSAVFACGMLALCIGVVGNGYAQKVNFDNAMCYLNKAELEYPSVKVPMLKASLRYMQHGSELFFGRGGRPANNSYDSIAGPPILSEFYHRVFFAGKTLDYELYEQLNQIFVPEDASTWHRPSSAGVEFWSRESNDVKLADLKTETRFDEASGVYRAWVHMTLKNESQWPNQEYAVRFTLPEGVFVSDYYLDVLGTRKSGIVSEKNAAKSVYNNIVSQSKDPGIICYAQGNTVELRVFPFNEREARQTGFELTYLQSDSFQIGAHTIALEGRELTEPVVAGGACFMPASYKANLKEAAARPITYYFVADTGRQPLPRYDPSYDEQSLPEERLAQIKAYAQANKIADANVYLTCYDVKKTDLANLDKAKSGKGGFNLALAMEMIYEDAKKQPESCPIIIVATDRLYYAAIADNRRFTLDYPETEAFYLLDGEGNFIPHNLTDHLPATEASASAQIKRLSYNGFFFRNDGKNEVAYGGTADFSGIPYGSNAYQNALLLSERIEKAVTDEQMIETVRDGMRLRLLAKNNSFIVLETKGQEDELNRRNQDFLDGKTLSASGALMSEPGIFSALLFVALLLVVMYFKRRRRSKAAVQVL